MMLMVTSVYPPSIAQKVGETYINISEIVYDASEAMSLLGLQAP